MMLASQACLGVTPPFLPKLNFKGAFFGFFLALEENPEYLITKKRGKVKFDGRSFKKNI